MNPTFLQQADLDILVNPGGGPSVLDDLKEDLKTFDIKELPKILGKVAATISNYHHYIWVGDAKGEFFKYYRGCWYSDVDISLDRLIRIYCQEVGISMNTKIKEDLRARIKEMKQLLFKEFNEDRNLINFQNGFLDLMTRVITKDNYDNPYDTKYTVQIPWEYDEGLTPLKFLPWIYSVFEGDFKRVDLLLKAVGYALTLHVKYQRLFMLKGAPRTGKSTFLNILHALVGDENTSAVSLQRLAYRFGTWGIVGKIVNFHADIPTDKPVNDTSAIKTLIDDTIDYEIKGGKVGVRAKNITKHFFSTNRMPPVRGLDLAYARRWIIIEFNKIIAQNAVIADFEKFITEDKKEMEAIISLAIDAYWDLEEEGQFASQTPEEVLELIQRETDTVYRFLQDTCDLDPRYQDSQDAVYDAYVDYAAADGCTDILKKGAFTSDLYSKGYGKGRLGKKDDTGKRPYTYTGLKLQETEMVDTTIQGELLPTGKTTAKKPAKIYGVAARKPIKTMDELIEEKKLKEAKRILQESATADGEDDSSMKTYEPNFDKEENGDEEDNL
jgi:P4 family phage/plasmid primase-like protien